jgi:hypothetical protein
MKTLSLFLLTMIASLLTNAQIVIRNNANSSFKGSIRGTKKEVPIITLPTVDRKKLKEEDDKDAKQGLPPRFAAIVDLNLNTEKSGVWEDFEDGQVWKAKIVSDKAVSLHFLFDSFRLPDGSELYLYSEDGKRIAGPITSKQNSEKESYLTPPLLTDHLIIELFVKNTDKSKFKIKIGKAFVGYQLQAGYGQSCPVNSDNNVVCPQYAQSADEAEAVNLVLVGGNRWCSGCLMNNTCQNYRPLILTAMHCVDYLNSDGTISQNERDNIANFGFMFRYWSPTCNPPQDNTSSYLYITSSEANAILRASWSVSDFALIELNREWAYFGYDDIRFAGWSRTGVAPTNVTGIHHPNGDVMKVAVGNMPSTAQWPGQPYGGTNSHWQLTFTDGITEGGSSGSPLFDTDGRVIGQLTGVTQSPTVPSCDQTPPTYYGRFALSWNGGGSSDSRLRDWLDPTNSGPIVLNSLRHSDKYIQGPANVACGDLNSQYTYTVGAPGQNVIWEVGGFIIVGGQGTNTVTVKRDPAGSQNPGNYGYLQYKINCLNTLFTPVGYIQKIVGFNCGGRMAANSDESSEDILIVYPNPALNTAKIRWKTDSGDHSEVNIVSLSGKNLFKHSFSHKRQEWYETDVDLSEYLSGGYLVEITTAKNKMSKRLIINH